MARTITAESVNNRNAFNALANEVEGHLIRLVNEWQNRKVWKTSGYGGLTAAFNNAFNGYCADHSYNIPHTEANPTSRVWLNLYCSHNQIIANLRDLNSALKVDLYLGRVDDTGVVDRISACHQRLTNYTVENVSEAFKRAYELETEARVLRSSVSDFD
jgi:hypothetical protein